MWIDYNHPDYRRLLLGEGIETKYMTEASIHPDLLAKRDIWLSKFYQVKYRSLIIKNVTMCFIYKQVRYIIDYRLFRDHALKHGNTLDYKIYPNMSSWPLEDCTLQLLERTIIPELLAMGLTKDEIYLDYDSESPWEM
jgi:hypothetical protein